MRDFTNFRSSSRIFNLSEESSDHCEQFFLNRSSQYQDSFMLKSAIKEREIKRDDFELIFAIFKIFLSFNQKASLLCTY